MSSPRVCAGLLILWLLASDGFGAEASRVFYLSGNQTLQGCVYKPPGVGPFPTIIFHQGVTKPLPDSERSDPYPALGAFYTSKGYALFVPARRTVANEQGDEENALAQAESTAELGHQLIAQYDERAADVQAAVAWLKTQAYVDEKRIVITGFGGGAVETLFAAEKEMGVRGVVVFSPAALSWKKSSALQRRLKRAVNQAPVPIFLLQPENDYSTLSGEALGKELKKKGRADQSRIYPPYAEPKRPGSAFATEGTRVWGQDVLAFVESVLR